MSFPRRKSPHIDYFSNFVHLLLIVRESRSRKITGGGGGGGGVGESARPPLRGITNQLNAT